MICFMMMLRIFLHLWHIMLSTIWVTYANLEVLCTCLWSKTTLSSSLSPGRDGGAEVWDAGDEGHVHGGRRLPAAGTTATAGAGRTVGTVQASKVIGKQSSECHVWARGAPQSQEHHGHSKWLLDSKKQHMRFLAVLCLCTACLLLYFNGCSKAQWIKVK